MLGEPAEPCAVCGLIEADHMWPPKDGACREHRTAYDLRREREEGDGAWMFDPDMESQG